jgi:hypothetical protein
MTTEIKVTTQIEFEAAAKTKSNILIAAGSFVLAFSASSPLIILEGEASLRIEVAQDTSRVVAMGSSSVVARDTSSVVAWGFSSVVAMADVFVRAFGGKSIFASKNVIIKLHQPPSKIIGGIHIGPSSFSTPLEWCDHFGCKVEDGKALLFKGVDSDFKSDRGGEYTPRSIPICADWDGGKQECGYGYHVSPHPLMTKEFCNPKKFIAGWVDFADMAVHANGQSPQKCKIHKYASPVWECDEYGEPVVAEAVK